MSARFVKLTEADGLRREVHIRADTISLVTTYAVNGAPTGNAYVHRVDGLGHHVEESPAEILALLAEPAPSPSVEVTEAAVEAALDGEYGALVNAGYRRSWREAAFPDEIKDRMRLAIIAADRARGLRR